MATYLPTKQTKNFMCTIFGYAAEVTENNRCIECNCKQQSS